MKMIALCFLFMGCNTSCEKQGGKWLQDGYYTVWQTIGGVSYPQQYPIYVCKKEKNT